MLGQSRKSQYIKQTKQRISQGDILSRLNIAIGTGGDSDNDEFTEFFLNYGVVMSQDCDVEWDYDSRKKEEGNRDKYVQTILVCPAYLSDHFFRGEHIERETRRKFEEKEIEKLKRNDEYKRYHFLRNDLRLQIPTLVIDFKNFFTIPTELLYSIHVDSYVATIDELFRESLSQRFANYLSRIGLPELESQENSVD